MRSQAHYKNFYTYQLKWIPTCMHVWSVASNSLGPSQTVAHQASLSMGFPRQEYRSGLPFPPPGDVPYPETESHISCVSSIASGFFSIEPPGKPIFQHRLSISNLIYLKWIFVFFFDSRILLFFNSQKINPKPLASSLFPWPSEMSPLY